MKFYFFLTLLCFLINTQAARSQADQTTLTAKYPPALGYPSIRISKELAEKLFNNSGRNIINCPVLFNNNITFPSGTSVALCDDAQLACLRYGLLVKEMETAKGKYLEELKKTLVLEKHEVTIRLRGCELALKKTANGEPLQDVAGYPPSGTSGSDKTY